jgi:hypothetical protein
MFLLTVIFMVGLFITDYCLMYIIAYKSAFCVGSSAATISNSSSSIVFDVPVTTTVYSPYNVTSKTVTSVPETGVYWFTLAAGAPANTAASIILYGLSNKTVVSSKTTNCVDDVMVADTIQNVSTSDSLIVINPDYPSFGTRNNVTGTSLLGFRLDNIMSDQVYFSVQRTAAATTHLAVITFDRVLINVGNAWSAVNNAFTAPCAGTYFFSYAFGATGPTLNAGLSLCLNGNTVGGIGVNDNTFNNVV